MADETETGTETGDSQNTEHNQAPSQEEVERQARDMGWAPKENWRGPEDKWLDAAEFVKRGETYVPYLRHERARLNEALSQRDQTLTTVQRELAETKAALKEITDFNTEMAKDRKERRKAEIQGELTAAREAGNDVRVAELNNELQEIVKPASTKPAAENRPGPTVQIQPWVRTFIDGNADFFKDQDRIALFNVEMAKRRGAGDSRVGEIDGTALLSEARDAVEKKLGGNSRRAAPSKTEESRSVNGQNGANRRGGQTYNDMPQEARDACDKQESRFVGEKKAFKDQTAWRKHFATEFFGPSATAAARAAGER